jgi:hypothetical protein
MKNFEMAIENFELGEIDYFDSRKLENFACIEINH